MTSAPPPAPDPTLSLDDLHDAWPSLEPEERWQGFRLLGRVDAETCFLGLPARDQAMLMQRLPVDERRSWLRLLTPDDAADLVQRLPAEEHAFLLGLLDGPMRTEVQALLAHAEDEAGGLMNPHFVRVRPEMLVDEAIGYIRKQARERMATIYYVYVLDPEQRLLGAVSLRELFTSAASTTVQELMRTDIERLTETTDQEEIARLFARHDLLAMPVVDAAGRMVGIVTVDDVVDVVNEAATEDIQKMGGGDDRHR
ncbi:MAG: magnesium transporter, partial [Myxococcales bacterium]